MNYRMLNPLNNMDLILIKTLPIEHNNHKIDYPDENYIKLFHFNEVEIFYKYIPDKICKYIINTFDLYTLCLRIDSDDYWAIFFYALSINCKISKKYSKKILHLIYTEYLNIFFNATFEFKIEILLRSFNDIQWPFFYDHHKFFFPKIYKSIKNKTFYKVCLSNLFGYNWQVSLKLYIHNLNSIDIKYYDLNILKYIYLYL